MRWKSYIALLVTLRTLSTLAVELDPGPRQAACGFSWNNQIFIMGGQMSSNYSLPFVQSLPAPFQTTQMTWLNVSQLPSTYYFDHTCAMTSTGMVYSVQGPEAINSSSASSFFTYDLRDNLWADSILTTGTLASPSQYFSSLTGHAITIVQDRYLFITGGYFSEKVGMGSSNNESFILDLQTMRWSNISLAGGPPSGLSYSGIAPIGEKVYIFGGRYGEETMKTIKSIYSFNISSNSWALEQVTLDQNLTHIGTAVNMNGDKIFLVPGRINDGITLDSRVRIYDPSSNAIMLLETPENAMTLTDRFRHSVFTLENTLLVYGGLDANGSSLSDLHAFDMDKLVWGTSVPAYAPISSSSVSPSSTTVLPAITVTSSSISTIISSPSPSDHIAVVAGAIMAVGACIIFLTAFLIFRHRRNSDARREIITFVKVSPPEKRSSGSEAHIIGGNSDHGESDVV